MAREAKSRQAIRETRDDSGIVHISSNGRVEIVYSGRAELSADILIEEDRGRWLISPDSARKPELRLY